MKFIALIFVAIFLTFFLFFIIVLSNRSSQVQNSATQKEFLKGKVPSAAPNGFYKGSVGGLKTPWQGKKFNAVNSTGVNILKKDGNNAEAFPFKTYVGKGIADKKLDVFKIDYSSNRKPWWIKFVLDEVVETSPGHLLGKAHLTFIPDFPFTVGFFKLER